MILFVDDEPFFVDAYREALISAGYEVSMQKTLQAAMTLFQQEQSKVDLVISDVMLSSNGALNSSSSAEEDLLGGMALHDWLRKRSCTLPIIILTNKTTPDVDRRISTERHSWLFRKGPRCQPSQLVREIDHILNRKTGEHPQTIDNRMGPCRLCGRQEGNDTAALSLSLRAEMLEDILSALSHDFGHHLGQMGWLISDIERQITVRRRNEDHSLQQSLKQALTIARDCRQLFTDIRSLAARRSDSYPLRLSDFEDFVRQRLKILGITDGLTFSFAPRDNTAVPEALYGDALVFATRAALTSLQQDKSPNLWIHFDLRQQHLITKLFFHQHHPFDSLLQAWSQFQKWAYLKGVELELYSADDRHVIEFRIPLRSLKDDQNPDVPRSSQ